MKASDLKPGVKIRRVGERSVYEVTAVGINVFLLICDNRKPVTETWFYLDCLSEWEPVEPESELYYRWVVKVPRWHSPISYYCETGHDTNGHSFHNWDNIEKRIRLDIAPIDKNGREHPKGQR